MFMPNYIKRSNKWVFPPISVGTTGDASTKGVEEGEDRELRRENAKDGG